MPAGTPKAAHFAVLGPDDNANANALFMGEDLTDTELGFWAGGNHTNLRLFWLRARSWKRTRILGASLLIAGVAAATIGSKVALPSAIHRADKSEQMAGSIEVLEGATSNASRANAKDKTKLIPDPGMGWPTTMFWPRLFCFSVMNKDNAQEIATMKMQIQKQIGIAACERFVVLSGERIYLGQGHKWDNGTAVDVWSWVNPAKPVAMGNLQAGDDTNSFKNTEIFINAWRILISSKALEGTDWAVKADPDAVFFPERLRKHVKKFSWGTQTKTPMYFKNCNFHGAKLYGALEVFNAAAMKELSKRMSECLQLPWRGWGEDEFIDKCMERLGAQAKNDFTLVGDHRCMSAECEDTWRASFHDYKSELTYLDCWNRSRKSEEHQKMMKEGHFFCCTSSWNPQDPCNSCHPGALSSPGKGWCGSSKNQCQGCSATASWCKRDNHSKRNVLA